jgi:two-component system, NarL family, sensor kinase
MRKTLIVILFLIVYQALVSQRIYTLNDDQNFIDSLKLIVQTTKSDSLRCITNFKLADLYRRNKNTKLSSEYLNLANTAAPKFSFLNDVALFYNASTYFSKGDFKTCEELLLRANEKLKKYPIDASYSLRALILKNISVLNQIKDNDKEAMRVLLEEAVPVAKKSDDFEVLSGLYKGIAIILMNENDRKKAAHYLDLATTNVEKAKKSSYTLQESKLDTYILCAENLLELGKYKDAKASLNKAYHILKNYPESNLNGLFHYSQGLYYYKLNQFDNAIKSYDKGIENCILNKDKVALTRFKSAKYKSLIGLKKYLNARDLLIELLDSGNLFALDKKNYSKEIVDVCKKINDTKNGYKYSLLYIKLSDSLYDANSKKEIEALEAKYNNAEKEKQISQLEAQKQKAILVSENGKLYNGLFALLSFILVLIVVFLWKHANSQKKLAFEKEKNYQNSLTTLKNQKEIEVMQAAISGEEIERKRIARDLHDGVGSMLSSLKMRLVKTQSNDSIDRKEIEDISVILNNSITELRHVAYNLVPEALLKLGLEHALSDLCHALKTDTTTIHFQANEINKNISERNQITIYRIVQELLNNALKHANGTEILVDCSQNKNSFYLTIEDNGIGFDMNKSHTFVGLGLKNLKNRVDLLNGKIEIDSTNNGGTMFNIELIV